jgi:hypothetical protein
MDFPLGGPDYPEIRTTPPPIIRIAAVFPAMINLLTRARISYLPFQNQTASNEDKTAGKPIICLRLQRWSIIGLERLNVTVRIFVHCRCLLYSYVSSSFSNYMTAWTTTSVLVATCSTAATSTAPKLHSQTAGVLGTQLIRHTDVHRRNSTRFWVWVRVGKMTVLCRTYDTFKHGYWKGSIFVLFITGSKSSFEF